MNRATQRGGALQRCVLSIGPDSGQHHIPPDNTSPLWGRLAPSFSGASDEGSIPCKYLRFLRARHPAATCHLSVLGLATTLTGTSSGTGTRNPAAELASWQQLRDAMTAALNGDPTAAGSMLPSEVAAAEYERNGHRIRIRQPGSTTRMVRCARQTIRRGLSALTPLPLLGALSQPVLGGATAASIALAPLVPTPATPAPLRLPDGIVRTPIGDVARPAPFVIAGTINPAVSPAAPLVPAVPPVLLQPTPAPAASADTGPNPTAPTLTVTVTPTRTRHPAATPSPSSERTASPKPTSTPSSTPLDAAPTPSASPTAHPSATPPPTGKPTQKHHRHHKHPLRHAPRGH